MKCIEEEIPFEVPEGWEWSRLGTAFLTITGNTPSTKDESLYGDDFPFYKPTDLDAGFEVYSSESTVSKKGYSNGRSLPEQSVLVTCIGATIGKTGFIRKTGICNQQINAILPNEKTVPEYTFFSMCSELEQHQILMNASATTLPILNKSKFDNLLFPVPPYREQILIVEKLKEVLSHVGEINNDRDSLYTTIKMVKDKILDLAIRGRLVPQNPDDEPASVLLERIHVEKEELIKQGKIKRDKKETIIFKGEDNSYYLNDGQMTLDISDDLPFDIPDSWEWVRLKDVFIINPRNKLDDDLNVSFIPMSLIEDGYGGKHTAEVRHWKEVKTGFTHFAEGDIGVAKITPCFENRKSTVFENLTNGYGAGTTELHVLRPFGKSILAQYLLAYVKSDYFVENGKQVFTGAVGQQRIGKEYVENAYFPLPPIKEQRRIVQQIAAVFEYLNMMSEALS
ncbi:MAG TPA: restriction endonuclease subunit S [Candidatus Mediterraneibacter vanvlietii]|nr:restriction endonuclease subunit S [Candidatus Mediterraneibacter vanvlietii]